jgi:Na+-transporting NADH:ubiquinone oxidoreductase subunit F
MDHKKLCRVLLVGIVFVPACAIGSGEKGQEESRAGGRTFPRKAKVIKIETLNHNIKRFRLAPENGESFVFTPGQHVFVKVPDEYLADFNKRYKTTHEDIYRPYSFASSPSERSHFDLIIKHYGTRPGEDFPPGVVSTYLHKHLEVGDTLTLSDPNGELYAKDDSDRPIVILAGGVGVSPFVCLLQYWFESKVNERRKIYFFLGVRSKKDLVLHDQFTRWSKEKKNFVYVPALSRPADGTDWKGETGYINKVFESHFKESVDADAYIAGSPIMTREAIKSLESKGVDEERIHRDPIRVKD